MNRRGFLGSLIALAAAPFARLRKPAPIPGRYSIGTRVDMINDDVAAAMRQMEPLPFKPIKGWKPEGYDEWFAAGQEWRVIKSSGKSA